MVVESSVAMSDSSLVNHLECEHADHLGNLLLIVDLGAVGVLVVVGPVEYDRELIAGLLVDLLELVVGFVPDFLEQIDDVLGERSRGHKIVSLGVLSSRVLSSRFHSSRVHIVRVLFHRVLSSRVRKHLKRATTSDTGILRRKRFGLLRLKRTLCGLAIGICDLSAGLQFEHSADDLLDRLLGNSGVARRERVGRLVVGDVVLLQRIAQALVPGWIFGLGTCDRRAAVLDLGREQAKGRNEFGTRFALTLGLDGPGGGGGGVVDLGWGSAATTTATTVTVRLRRTRLAAIGQEVRHEAGRTLEPVVRCEVANLDVRELQIWRMVGHELIRDRVLLRVAVHGRAREVQRQVRQERFLDLLHRLAVPGCSLD